MTSTDQEPVFPCPGIPQELRLAKLAGLHPQLQDGLWMQRIKIMGGELTASQWDALAQIVRDYTPLAPLHLTTRQDIELHDVTGETAPAVHQVMSEAGLTGLGAGGDSLRNITICPCSGISSTCVDLYPLARQIHETLNGTDGIYSLPRKFKIMLACSDGCGQPWINDLGLVARRTDDGWGFRVTAGGSLGAKPGAAMLLHEWLPAADVLPLVVAAVGVFAAHGDRENRTKARLRHVRQRLGDEAFSALMAEEFAAAKAQRSWPDVELTQPADPLDAQVVLTFKDGDITADAAEALGQLTRRDEFRVRISNHHRVIVFGRDESSIRSAVEQFDALRGPAVPQGAVVTCPGKKWCIRALVYTDKIAEKIRAELGERLSPRTVVCISGCPNGCAHNAVAEIGLGGRLTTRDGARQEAFNLFAGGNMGRDGNLAALVGENLSANDAIGEIAKLLDS